MKKILLISSILVFLFLLNVQAQTDQAVTAGMPTNAVTFPGPGCTYNWVNDKPGIGLAASGTGDIGSFTAVNSGNTPVTANITAMPMLSGFAYIANYTDGTVSVIDIATNLVVKIIPVGGNPLGVSVSSDGSRAYVSVIGLNEIAVINTSTNTVLNFIPAGPSPEGLCVSPDGSLLYVTNYTSNLVTIFNTSTNSVVAKIPVGRNPNALCISPDGTRVYVANSNDASISVINTTNNQVQTVTLSGYPTGITISPDGQKIYVTNGTVTIINAATNSISGSIPGGFASYGIAVSPDGKLIYQSTGASNIVTVMSTLTNSVVKTIAVGLRPEGVSISPDGSTVYVANAGSNTVSIISTSSNTLTTAVPVGASPNSIGNFIAANKNCTPVQFSITVNPANAIIPTIAQPVVTGNILACFNAPSVSPYIQQFTVNASNLAGDITATASSVQFEVSLNPNSGYGASVTIPQVAGAVNGVVVYARAGAISSSGPLTGSVKLTSPGALPVNAGLSGTVNELPTIGGMFPQFFTAGQLTTSINFVLNGCNVKWTNSNPSIGLPASGTGNILPFTAVNAGTTSITGAIFATPVSITGGCLGIPTLFTITISPGAATLPTITTGPVTGAINACVGTASTSPHIQQFTVSGSNLPGDILASAPSVFEVSLSPNSGYGNFVTLKETGGVVNSTIVYIRSAATASAGIKSGFIDLNSGGFAGQPVPVTETINALPAVNTIPPQSLNNGQLTNAVNFTGTGDLFNWINDTPGIGLAASGIGNISAFTAVNTGSSLVTATITATPSSVTFAYIPNYGSNNVSVINTTTNTVIKMIPVDNAPWGVSVSPNGNFVYVTNQTSNSVSVIDATTNLRVKTIGVGLGPEGITVSPNGSRVYVANETSGTVAVIDAATNQVISNITVASNPQGITVSPDGNHVYVTSATSNKISVISTATNLVTATIGVGSAPIEVAVSPDNSKVYVANLGSGDVSVINATANTLLTTIPVGSSPDAVTVSPDGKFIYVANGGSGSVSVISALTNAVISSIPGLSSPEGVSVSQDGTLLYIANFSGASVSVFDIGTNSLTATIGVGQFPGIRGNFLKNGTGCTGNPTQFTITVNPDPAAPPTITTGPVTGTINACVGTASASPNIQQFTVSGSNLPGDILASAPSVFEVSLSPNSGYGNFVTLKETGGVVNSTIVYVRSAATASAGIKSGPIDLTSGGFAGPGAPVTETINALPTVNTIYAQRLDDGQPTTAVHFTGTGDQFNWTNDTPGIGLNANGTGNISSFIAVNKTTAAIVAHITVTPSSQSAGCTGPSDSFTITVNPDPAAVPTIAQPATTGNIVACLGDASVSPYIEQFTVNATNLTGDITATVVGLQFEISLNPNSGYSSSLTIPQTGGAVTNVVVYARAAATGSSGNLTGGVKLTSPGALPVNAGLTGVVNGLPYMGGVSPQVFTGGQLTSTISFITNGNNVSWTNNNPAIGLPASGTGDILPFTAVNNTGVPITAEIIATPVSVAGGCTGTPISFIITINPAPATLPTITQTTATGNNIACLGAASISPNIQQFTVNGTKLTGDIMATVTSAGFEISLNANSGYGNSLTIPETGGTINNVIVYVRLAATTTAGNVTGGVQLTSPGAAFVNVGSIAGVVNVPPVMDGNVPSPTYVNGQQTAAINFSANGNTVNWINDTPGIGLPSSGTGDIPSFTAINTGTVAIIAHIIATPTSPGTGCTGTPVPFTITVSPTIPPSISVIGPLSPLNTIYGTASTSTVFSVLGAGLTAGILVTPPPGFEVSTNDFTFAGSVTISSAGTQVYIRLAATTPVGNNYLGPIVLKSLGAADASIDMPQSTVSPAPLTIAADNKSKTAGTANPVLTATYTGFVNGDTPADLISPVVLSTTANILSPIGQYPITLSGYASANYTITPVPGILTVIGAIVIPNTFTPNGDGVNDTWNIKYLDSYSACTVQIFNRYGENVFSSVGYGTPWDGTFKGSKLPTGTYYYVINLKNDSKLLSGFIAIIR